MGATTITYFLDSAFLEQHLYYSSAYLYSMVKASDFPEDLLDFYGTECVHCNEMNPMLEQLQKDLNVKIRKVEVWHNEENARLLEELDKGRCGAVPFFFNKKTGKFLCGAQDYETVKKWALGK